MTPKAKTLLVTALVAVPAFLLGAGTPLGAPIWRAIWPFHEGDMTVTWQLPFFMAVSALEALAMGLGVAFALFGARMARRVAPGARPGLFVAAATWLLANWWVHDSLHITNGMDPTGLLAIDVAFHSSLILCGLVVVSGLLSAARQRAPVQPHATPSAPRVVRS